MKKIKSEGLNKNKEIPVFQKGDIIHFENEGVLIEATIVDVESPSGINYFDDDTGRDIQYTAKVEMNEIHNLWGFAIKELTDKNIDTKINSISVDCSSKKDVCGYEEDEVCTI